MTPTTSRYRGPVPASLWAVLTRAWENGISLQGDYARAHAAEVALGASCGWLSNLEPDGTAYHRQWRITASGLTALQHKDTFPTC